STRCYRSAPYGAHAVPWVSPRVPLVFQVRVCTLPDLPMESRRPLCEFLRLWHHHDAVCLAENQQLVPRLESECLARSLRDDHLILAAELDGRIHGKHHVK